MFGAQGPSHAAAGQEVGRWGLNTAVACNGNKLSWGGVLLAHQWTATVSGTSQLQKDYATVIEMLNSGDVVPPVTAALGMWPTWREHAMKGDR